jgi:enterochelin esterase-like enzyme
MKKVLVCFFAFVVITTVSAQSSVSQLVNDLRNANKRASTLQQLIAENKIPLIVADSVLFIYQGAATDVKWMGDFNGWGYNKNFKNTGTLLPGSDVWILKASFPTDARLDYKIVVNGTQWILDPLNPNHQWSGVGGGSPNSELRMPAWKPDSVVLEQEAVKSGKLIKDVLFNSTRLNYQVMYSVYLPVGYSPNQRYPVVYVTDGYEYLHENMGNMVVTLNNLIHQKKIKPVVAVFVDHREPVNRTNNRRMTELAMNESYRDFFIEELMPVLQTNYSISQQADERAILGTSMGGLTAAYFSFSRPDVFGLAGIQSPAFWFKPAIYTVCDSPEKPPVKVYMTTGVINDAEEGARKMKAILEKNTCTYQYKEVNEGHSWGNWRNLLDDILIYFFPTSSP